MDTTIVLIGKDAKLWSMMKALDGVGAFDVQFGRVTIDFNGKGEISNIKVEKNYRELSTP